MPPTPEMQAFGRKMSDWVNAWPSEEEQKAAIDLIGISCRLGDSITPEQAAEEQKQVVRRWGIPAEQALTMRLEIHKMINQACD